mgnify:CR=1 FL=1
MKKILILSLLGMLFLISLMIGCRKQISALQEKIWGFNESRDIDEIVSTYRERDYSYTNISYSYDDSDNVINKVVMEGTYQADPYEEHVKVIEAEDNIWDEAIYSGKGEVINVKLHTDSGWIDAKAAKSVPYGYGENLKFTYIGDKELINEMVCELYETEYTVNVAEQFANLKEELNAKISQKYYFRKDLDTFLRIETDLTDYRVKTAIVNDMAANGTSLEEATKNAENADSNKFIEIMEINFDEK